MARRKDNTAGLELTYRGRKYRVRQSDLSPRLVAELRRSAGFAGFTGLLAETQRGFDLDVLAAWIWLARRIKGELALPFETVLDEMDYDAVEGLAVNEVADKEEEPEPVPEA